MKPGVLVGLFLPLSVNEIIILIDWTPLFKGDFRISLLMKNELLALRINSLKPVNAY
jgi:hypothetical protein